MTALPTEPGSYIAWLSPAGRLPVEFYGAVLSPYISGELAWWVIGEYGAYQPDMMETKMADVPWVFLGRLTETGLVVTR